MPSYTTSLRLIQPATGEYPGDWGTQVNNGITALVDTSVAGTASITMTAADYTLSTASGATDEARAMFLVLGGTPGAARNVICPAVSKLYYVTNNTTGGFAQTVKTASGSGISVPNGASMVLRCDGTNVVEAQNSLGSIILNGGTANGVAYLNASKALTTGSALVFDGTNLGIGTSSPLTTLDVASAAASPIISLTATGAWRYQLLTDRSTQTFRIRDQSAGNLDRVIVDASGNLALGVTPSAWGANFRSLEVLSVGASVASSSAGNTLTSVAHNAYNDNTNWRYRASSVGAARYEMTGANAGSTHAWYVSAGGTAGNTISFTQAMTLTSGGDLLVGTTDAAINSGTGVKLKAGANNNVNAVGSDSTNTTSNYNLYSTGAAAYRFYVGMGGTIYATSTTITAISDQRLKENIRDLDAGLNAIMDLKPRKFDWKAGKGKDIKDDRGFIAQEFEQVFPDLIDEWKDPAPEGEEPYKAVRADLIPVLVKAIQEQQAIIEDLRARVAALEVK